MSKPADAGGAAELPLLFEKLEGHLQKDQFGKAISTLDKILKLDPNNNDARYSKLITLIQSDKLDSLEAALVLMQKPSMQKVAKYEKAYVLYRLGRLEEALAALEEVGDERREARLQLEALLRYRLGQADAAVAAYHELLSTDAAKSEELPVNMLAAYVSAHRASEVPGLVAKRVLKPDTSHEAAFNYACALLDAGLAREAHEQLEYAIKIGQEMLYERDVPEEEVEEELLVLRAQLAYAQARQQPTEEVLGELEELAKRKGGDQPTMAVLASNAAAMRVCMHRGEMPPKKQMQDVLKRLTSLGSPTVGFLQPELEKRLTDTQKEVILANRAVLHLLAGQAPSGSALLQALAARFKGSERIALLQAACRVREEKVDEAMASLQAFCAAQPQSCVRAALMWAQLAAEAGQPAAALAALNAAVAAQGDMAQKPAVVATRFSLMQQAGDTEGAKALLSASLAATEQGGPAAVAARSWCLQQTAALQLKQGQTREALDSFRQLRRMGGGKRVQTPAAVLLKVAQATAVLDPQAAQEVEGELPALVGWEDLDLDDLEAEEVASAVSRGPRAGVPAPAAMRDTPYGVTEAGDAEGADGGAAAAHSRRKRRRKPRYPKGFDPENPGPPPDPERWLPKWERSENRRRRKRRERQQPGKGQHQGSGRVDERLDRTLQEAPAPSSGPKLPARPARGPGRSRK